MRKSQDRPTGYDWIVFAGWILAILAASAYTFVPRFTPGGLTGVMIGVIGAICTWPGRG